MTVSIRSATAADYDSIAGWTKATFEWGDYVPHRFHAWIEEPDSDVIVCVDSDDVPIAMANVVQLSPLEAWIEAARVHPDYRRKGLGTALNHHGVDWARGRGCKVMRLTTEKSNEAAISQVAGLGYKQFSNWIWGEIDIDATRRCEEQFRLRPAVSADAEAAWMSWSASELAYEGRDMIALRWRWRSAAPSDVTAPSEARLYHSAAGWTSVYEYEEALDVKWLSAAPGDLLPLIDGLADLTAAGGLPELTLKLPDTGWTREAVARHGGHILPLTIWAKPI